MRRGRLSLEVNGGGDMDDYLTIQEVAKKWDMTPRWVQSLCADGKIEGAIKFGRAWAVPKDAEKPADRRVVSGRYRNWRHTGMVRTSRDNNEQVG